MPRNVISLVNLLNEIIPKLGLKYVKLVVKYAACEGNQSTIAVAKALLMQPRTKHASLKHYHFR